MATILLVDDEPAVLETVRRLLTLNKFMVIEARDGFQALAICNEYRQPIDLLMTDIDMPNMSGVELARKAIHMRPGLQVLYMSGKPADFLHQKGFTDDLPLLQKPFTMEQLLPRVQTAITGLRS